MADKTPLILDTDGNPKRIQSGDKLPISVLATGTPDGTKFVRDDGTLAVPPGAGGGTDVVQDDSSNRTVADGYNHIQLSRYKQSAGRLSLLGSARLGVL